MSEDLPVPCERSPTQVAGEASPLSVASPVSSGVRVKSTILPEDLALQLETVVSNGSLPKLGVSHPREDTGPVARTYALLVLINIFINYDSGAVPAAVGIIQDEYGLTESKLGLLGSMPYWGLFVVSPLLGLALQKFSQKEFLGILLLLNAGMCVTFSYAKTFLTMAAARLLIGITQGGFVIYSPCWVDAMAPPASKTLWMGILQAVVPVGVVVGYFTTGLMTAWHMHWSLSLLCQAVLIGTLTIFFLFVPYRYVDDFSVSPRLDELRREWLSSRGLSRISEGGQFGDYDKQSPKRSNSKLQRPKSQEDLAPACQSNFGSVKRLATNVVFVSVTVTLCALWFIVTGIQYWVTEFLVEDFGVNKGLVVSMFSIVALSGPTIGVVLGAVVTDRRGGYAGTVPRRKAVRQCLFCASVATALGLVAGVMPGRPGAAFWIEIVLIWCILALGGAIVPTATGIMISSCGEGERSLASGAGQAMYNLFGYASGTLIPGIAVQNFGMRWGMRVLFGWCIFGVAGLACTLAAVGGCPFRRRQDAEQDEEQEEGETYPDESGKESDYVEKE